MSDDTFICFWEPGPDDEAQLICLSERSVVTIVKRMIEDKKRNDPNFNFEYVSDEAAIEDFMAIHWAWKKKKSELQ